LVAFTMIMKRIALSLFGDSPAGLLMRRRTKPGGIDRDRPEIGAFFAKSSLPFSAIP
jgi:hypothetical protein